MELKQLYTDLILEYNKDKTNKRKISSPTVHEHGHNPSCGDDIDIEAKVENGVITDLAYTGTGCAISQASADIMADLITGETVEEAHRLRHQPGIHRHDGRTSSGKNRGRRPSPLPSLPGYDPRQSHR